MSCYVRPEAHRKRLVPAELIERQHAVVSEGWARMTSDSGLALVDHRNWPAMHVFVQPYGIPALQDVENPPLSRSEADTSNADRFPAPRGCSICYLVRGVDPTD